MEQARKFLTRKVFYSAVLLLIGGSHSTAQFIDSFDGSSGIEWRTATGDGDALSTLEFIDGFARFRVDATSDRRNVWWAIIQATVSDAIDLEKLAMPGHELRIETRIRSSHAPRRVNLHVHTQRTRDFHSHLMEFDIPDTVNWHTISMTSSDFDARPGDTINAQFALMDWGRDHYLVDLEYFRADVVKASEAGPDCGEQVLYPPPEPDPAEFKYSVPVTEAGMIDSVYPDVNFSGWMANDLSVLTTDGTKTIILRWDLDEFRNQIATGYGMLALKPHSWFQATGTGLHDFDRVRLVEIINAEPFWTRGNVTYCSFSMEKPADSLFNTQMIIDIDRPVNSYKPIRIHIPRPVIQRMLDGKTTGIALYPLGALQASFYSGYNNEESGRPEIYFNIKE
jgi:hypothetical protein